MRILAVTPIVVSEEELVRRQTRYNLLAPKGMEVVLENLKTSEKTLNALATDANLIASERATEYHFQSADPERYDAFMPDCVLDPAINTHQERPVIGILESTVHFLASHYLSMAAIARNDVIANSMSQRVAGYLENAQRGSFGGTSTLDLTFDDIADTSKWNDRVERVVSSMTVDAVINGCSAVKARRRSHGPALVDPTKLALEYANMRNQISNRWEC